MNVRIVLCVLCSLAVSDGHVDQIDGFRHLPWLSVLPASFDAKTWDPWRPCHDLLGEVPFQSTRCGDRFAHITALTLSQRYCLNKMDTNSTWTKSLSTRHIETCANPAKNGCEGGNLYDIGKMLGKGVLSGSTLNKRHTGCQPYLLPTCLPDDFPPACQRLKEDEVLNAGACSFECDSKTESAELIGMDWTFGMAKTLDVEAIKRAIFYGGPVAAEIIANDDQQIFKNYSGGILDVPEALWISKTTNHVVAITGWGRERGTEFWHFSNTWANRWGENGYGRIVRGRNMLKIEASVFFPKPRSEDAVNGTFMVVLDRDNEPPYRCYSLAGGRICPHGHVKFGYKKLNLQFGCLEYTNTNYTFYKNNPYVIFQEKEFLPIKRTVHIPMMCAKIPSYWTK